MNKEWLMILAVVGGSALFAIGGTGYKWCRRFLLPILMGFIGAISGFPVWIGVCYGLGLCVALHMGYGERTPFWKKALVFCGYSAPSLLFGFTVWQVITPVVLIILFWQSNTESASREVPWKVFELLAGALIGITLAVLISKSS